MLIRIVHLSNRCLIAHGADTLARNDFNKTCVEYALDKGHKLIVDFVRPLQYARLNDWTLYNSDSFPVDIQHQVCSGRLSKMVIIARSTIINEVGGHLLISKWPQRFF